MGSNYVMVFILIQSHNTGLSPLCDYLPYVILYSQNSAIYIYITDISYERIMILR